MSENLPELKSIGCGFRLTRAWYTNCRGLLGHSIHVSEGFASDGASIPRGLRWLCGEPTDKPRVYAAIVHDWLYSGGGGYTDEDRVWHTLTRRESDRLYRDYQIRLGVPVWKAYAEWVAVRWCGRKFWANI